MKKKIIRMLVLLLVLVQVIDVIGMFRYLTIAYAEETVTDTVAEEVSRNEEKPEELATSIETKEDIDASELLEKPTLDVPEKKLFASDKNQPIADDRNEEGLVRVSENEEILKNQNYELTTDFYPQLDNADGTPKLDYLVGEEIILYSKLEISSGYFPSKQVKFRVTLAKKYFQYFGVVSGGLTFPVNSELSEDSENIYLDITIDDVKTGINLAIPFRVKLLSNRLYYGTKVPITQTLYDHNGEVLTENSLDLKAITTNRRISFMYGSLSQKVPNEYVNQNKLISSDFIDEVSYSILRDKYTDIGASLVEFKLTENVIFKKEDNDSAWTYDAVNHSISGEFKSNIYTSGVFKVRYKNVYTETSDYPVQFTGSVNVLNEQGEIETNLEKTSSVQQRKFFSQGVGATTNKWMRWKNSDSGYYIKENEDKELTGWIRANHNGEKGEIFLNKIEDVPTKVNGSSPFTLTEVWLSTVGNLANTDKNKVYGITVAGEKTLIAENIGATAFSIKDPQPFVSFYIEFDKAVELTSSTDQVTLNFSVKRSSEYWKYLSENLSTGDHRAFNDGNIYYTDKDENVSKSTSMGYIDTLKPVNKIGFVDFLNKSTMFLGEQFEMTMFASVSSPTNPTLIKPKLYVILPRGLELVDFFYDTDSVTYTEKKNFKNSGKTAIVIEPKTELKLKDFQKIFVPNKTKLSLRFNNAANYGNQSIESYLTYENNGDEGIEMSKNGFYNPSELDPYQIISEDTEKKELLACSQPISLIPPSSVFVDTAASVNEQQGFVHGKTDAVDQGDQFKQKLSILNYSNKAVPSLTGINILPHAGDLSTVANEDGEYIPRGSDLGYLLDGEVEGPDGYTVYYSYDKPSHLMAENKNKKWQQQGSKIDYNKVTMIKIELTNGLLEKNQEVDFTFPVKVPINKSIKHNDKMVNTFTVTTNDTNWIESRGSEIPVTAYSVKGSVYRDKNKNSQKDSDEPFLVGYEVELEQEEATEPIAKQLTNSRGEYDFSPVPARGDYTVRIKTKEGDVISEYLQSSEEIVATDVKLDPANNQEGIAAVTLAPEAISHTINIGIYSDLPILGTVELTKIDSVTKQVLAGANFRFEQVDGAIIEADIATDAEGKIRLENVPLGEYQLVETAAPFGYELDSTPIRVELLDEAIVKLTKENTPILVPPSLLGSAELMKIDGVTKEALSGAVFQLERADGLVVQKELVTNTEGKIIVTDLPLGNYQFVETAAPTDYKLDVEPVSFEVTTARTTVQVTKENVKKSESILQLSTMKQQGNDTGNKTRLLPATGEQALTKLINLGYVLLFLLLLWMFSKKVHGEYYNDKLNY
ncbi:hypothetical protein JZO78_07160 [Enterococcus ureilyticus]|uniref:MSCRAMM family protein n=1 Tax=Enterococcus ureilyticus TaxID=1131292 RepID=UPI001A90E11E|nr:SpaA isopeptide-forming pilin-related protein [Enterococcus ureilyticus]MBO0446120.1 hypothetical protein [Enterococcus ureilyticus]